MQHAASVKLVLRWLCCAFGPSAGLGVGKLPSSNPTSCGSLLAASLSSAASSTSSSLDEQLDDWAKAMVIAGDDSNDGTAAAGFGVMEYEEEEGDEDADKNGAETKDGSETEHGEEMEKAAKAEFEVTTTVVNRQQRGNSREYFEAERRLESLALRVVGGESGAILTVVWSVAQCWALQTCLPSDPALSSTLFAVPPSSREGKEAVTAADANGGGLVITYPLSNMTSACFVHSGLREWLLCWYSSLVQAGFKKNVPTALLKFEGNAPRGGRFAGEQKEGEKGGNSAVDNDGGGGGNDDDDDDDDDDDGDDCFLDRVQADAQCPGKHALKPFPTTSGSWWCSACSRAVRKGTVLRGCRKCD
jgi:hypothetical protein